jgi:hypothetical protein
MFASRIFIITMILVFFVVSTTQLFAERQIVQMEVAQNNLFSISPPESDASGEWIINNWDQKKLSLEENGERLGKKYFVFKPLDTGRATINLEFIENDRTTERMSYEITIQAGGEITDTPIQDPDGTDLSATNSTNEVLAQQESTMYELINRLYDRHLYEEALGYINQYEQRLGTTGVASEQRLTDIRYKKAEIILALNNIATLDADKRQQAITQINSLISQRQNMLQQLEANLDFSTQTGQLMIQLAEIQSLLNRWDDARTTYVKILTFFDEGLSSDIDRLILKARLGLAKTYQEQQDYESAYHEFDHIASEFIELSPEAMYRNKIYIHARNELEEILFFLARLYTVRSIHADYTKAFQLYRILASDEYFPGGRYQLEAQSQMDYLERNFLDYR